MTKALVSKVQEQQSTIAFLNSKHALLQGENERLRSLVNLRTNDVKTLSEQQANEMRKVNSLKAELSNRDIDIHKFKDELSHRIDSLKYEERNHRETQRFLGEKLGDANREFAAERSKKETLAFCVFTESLILIGVIIHWIVVHVRIV
jgi:hypothetical protein